MADFRAEAKDEVIVLFACGEYKRDGIWKDHRNNYINMNIK